MLAELNWDPRVPAGHIGVVADSGIITLTGHVENYADKCAAEAAARRVKGVRGVAEEIEVRLNHLGKRTDDEIATAIVNRLSCDVAIPHDRIKPTVERGWVTLTGEVHWRFEKDAAEQVVERLFGVVGISNDLAIKPRVDVEIIEDEIRHALHRSWLVAPEHVSVSAEGGTVRLAGKVSSSRDRRTAEAIAWASPGAAAVINLLSVE
ncbi:BON domain-containing protein [Sphingomonas sp. So64.6b]|uniref:BON domain-containing protein n=1 Tax=Sphingomonas sp. So64.6b TaxID=2997354 RepID=UPI001FCE54FA|nr:BON domain-containing protein [Sphingomonas sp. So64.6b]